MKSKVKYGNKLYLTLIFSVAIIAVFSYKHEIAPQNVSGSGNTNEIQNERFDGYFVKQISIKEYSEQGVLFSITAEKITHRNRKFMNLATYQNLKEIYILNFKLDAYAFNDTILLNGVTTAIQSLETQPFADEKDQVSIIEDQVSSNSSDKDNLSLLTQVLFEKITINMHHSANKKTSITAKTARINLGNENLVFEEDVQLISVDNSEILASQAVWSNKYNGIYFPKGYFFEKQHLEKAFFRLNEEGKLSKAAKIPTIAYTDLIAEKEQALYEQSFKNMSPYMKAIMGMPIQK